MENLSNLQELYTALADAQGEFPPIPRDETVKVKTRSGLEYDFSYAPLETIMRCIQPALAKHGLGIIQDYQFDGLVTILTHKSGQFYKSSPLLIKMTGEGPQELGKIITYMRRYQLSMVLNLSTDDDNDGNISEGNRFEKTKKKNIKESQEKDEIKTLSYWKSITDKIIEIEHLNNWYKKHFPEFGSLEKQIIELCSERKKQIILAKKGLPDSFIFCPNTKNKTPKSYCEQECKNQCDLFKPVEKFKQCPNRENDLINELFCNTECKNKEGCPAWEL